MYDIYYPHPTLLEFPGLNITHKKGIVYSLQEQETPDYTILVLLSFSIFSRFLSSNKVAMNKILDKISKKLIKFYGYDCFENYNNIIYEKPFNIKPPKMETIYEEKENEQKTIETEQKKPELPYLKEIEKLRNNSLSTDSLKTIELTDTEKNISDPESDDDFHVGWIDIKK